MLVIGLGAGVTAGAVAIAPTWRHVDIVEIEPLVPKSVAAYFGDYNYHVVDHPKVSMLIDDGRHLLLTTDKKFDVITSDPVDPWIKGAATLFTEEFFKVVRAHLKPGGVVTQFVQLYGSNTDAVKSEIGTFIKVFPSTVVFGNLREGQGYDLVLVGQVEPMTIDVDALAGQARRPVERQGGPVAQRDRHLVGDRAARQLRRRQRVAPPLARGRRHQHRSEPPAAVPGGTDPQHVRQRRHLSRDARIREISRTALHRRRRRRCRRSVHGSR